VFRQELASQTNVPRKLFGQQHEAFILGWESGLARFDLHQAETASPVAPAADTN
jgi:hypothetical protein